MPAAFPLIVFALLAIASAFVLLPLWNGARRTAFAVALALPVAAVALYVRVGTPLALDPANLLPPTPEKRLDQLATQLRTHPDSLDDWIELARGRTEQERFPEALDAWEHARKLAPNEPNLLVASAETMALADPQHHVGDGAVELLRQAKAADPRNQRALWFLGIAAYQRGQFADAASTWEPLLTLAPADTRPALRKQIDDARSRAGLPPLPAEAAATAGPVLLRVRVAIDPALRAKLVATDTLFVFARVPGGPPMPLAVKRLPAKDFPADVELTDADGPMPTAKLSQNKTVEIIARVSHAGDALARKGDFEAAPAQAEVGAKDAIALTIDRIDP